MDRVVIDTSVWIESFRPKKDLDVSLRVQDLDVSLRVQDLILKDRVLMPGIIKTELLRGARTKSEFNRLSDLLKGLTYLPAAEAFWEKLSEFSFQLFRKGISVPLTDTYIALLCIENKAPLFHRLGRKVSLTPAGEMVL